MNYRAYIYTLALLGALALAAVSGGLFTSSDNVVYAAEPPVFDDSAGRSVPENTPPGVNIGLPISATDPDETGDAAIEFGNTLTYSLQANADTTDARAEAASFDIDPLTGQLITKAPLDTEGKSSYTVGVRVDDGETRETPVTRTVFITVTDLTNEAPLAPHPPTVVSGADNPDTADDDESLTTLKVVWHMPENMGRPAISGYAVAYKKSTETEFTVGPNPGTDTTTTITRLEADTSYDVRVQATNLDGPSPWSLLGTGSTNKEGNSRPQSNDDTPATRRVDENTPAGENVGSPVTATDGDTTTLTYGIEGPHADMFSFDTRSGQIRTKAPLNHESEDCGYVEPDSPDDPTTCTYRVTVTVVDGAGGSDATGVNIQVEDRTEPPSAPGRPTVRATEKSSTSLDVSWTAPENRGPAITGYVVQYRKGSESFSPGGVTVTGTTATISGIGDHDNNAATDDAPWLSPNTSYEVRVRATSAERPDGSFWSATGSGRTSGGNRQPIFDARPGTGDGSTRNSEYTTTLTINENLGEGQVVGRVFADDADNDRLTYKLVATDTTDTAAVAQASKFTINENDKHTGQIRTKAALNHESADCGYVDTADPTTCTYTVKVEVRDEKDEHGNVDKDEDAADSITVDIVVRDRDEKPAVPTVMVTSPSVNTTLEVYWHAKNTGPPITGYDVQYRKGGGTFSNDNCRDADAEDNCDNIPPATTDTKITELEEDTSYSVQVRAKNNEGTSAWSSVVTVKTNKDRVSPDQSNNPPVITTPSPPLSVDENTPSNRDVGAAVSASDDASASLTYSMGGRDAALFTIVSSTGQIRTRAALNTEAVCNPADADLADGHPENCTYRVRVKVDDRAGGSASIPVTITVNDVDEPPTAPSAPRVTATKDTGQSLDVTWNAPQNTGKPPITDYDIQYRKYKSSNPDDWELWPHGTDDAGNTDRSAKITRRLPGVDEDPLEPRTQYEVRVKAKNGEDDSTTANWSSVGRGTTGPSNSRPSFDREDAVITLRVDENTRTGQNVGSAVSASDTDSNTLTYSLEGPNKDSFTILSSSGQIRTRSPLNYEERDEYSLTVKVDDRQNRKNSVAAKSVTIMVDDVDEPPPPPAAPRVSGIPGSTSSIRVMWAAPANTGPPVTRYDVHYREVGTGPTRWDHFGADRSTIITGLKAGTRYEVQVRARSAEGTGDWSRWGSGMPNPDVANRNPTFSGGARTLSVDENTLPNTDVGAPVAATDRDGDTLTYSLEGADADSFDILSTSDGGQIRTSAALNHEEKASYSVTVRVRDGRGGTDAVNLTIRVTDVDGEAPDTPFAPTVTAISSTSLQVIWEKPANTGPPITDYDYRFREPSGSWTEVTNTTITATAETIEGLAASTSYDVEVRAKNAEGTSDWSNPGIGATNAPGANNPPVFSEGATATRSVSATATAGTSIGLPIAATDADSDDTLTYSLEGRDAALFDIGETNGQLLTKSGVTLLVGETYTVIVAADDQTEIARITVSIDATAAPPNNPPVFSDGASTTRTVPAGSPAGTSIGTPVAATDADQGDTLTYSLEGQDEASFNINSSTGQLLTISGVTLTAGEVYAVTVAASDTKTSATITVTITVTTALPTTFGCATRGAVDASNSGLVDDCEALLRARNNLENGNGARILNWSVIRPISQWDGVTVSGTPQRVTQLNLRSMGLVGTLPADLNELTMLTRLWLHNNSLAGEIPNLNRLTNLESLWLSGKDMDLSGNISRLGLGSKTRLDTVSLWGNSLTGSIPDLSRLHSLVRLKLQTNSLSGGVPASLGNLGSLRDLRLRNNNLRGSIPSQLSNIASLQILALENTGLTGNIPDLSGLTSLRTLNLRNNNLTGSIPTWLEDMDNMVILNLHTNRLTGSIPSELGDMDKLNRLYLHNNRLTGDIPSELGDLSDTLTHLWLAGNTGLTGCVPSALSGVANNDLNDFHLSICQ